MTLDPIHQFNINNIFTIGHIGGRTIAFTNSTAYMLLAVAVIYLVAIAAMRGRQLVPGRIQSMAELSYEFVATMIRSNAGQEGMKFFPLVYSIFMFILVTNVVSIIPYTFSVTSQIIVTATFALLVFFTVLRLLQKRAEIPQDFRAAGRSDVHPAAGRRDRDRILSVAATVTQCPSVR